MPPKHKLNREGIVAAAVELAEKGGLDAVTARDLGELLGVSSRPLYSHFASVEELKNEVVKHVTDVMRDYVSKDYGVGDPFLNMGVGSIRFAKEKKALYCILHDRASVTGLKSPSWGLLESLVDRLTTEPSYAEFSKEEIRDLMMKMTVFNHGLTDLMYQGSLDSFTDGDIVRFLRETGHALIVYARLKKKGESMK